jgi:DNA-binding transcriptional LysR family regulator
VLKLEQLRCLVAAAERGTFAEAAQHLNLSPAAVSYAINNLEDSLRTTLLVRRPAAGVAPTADGLRLIRQVRPMLDELNEIELSFNPDDRELRGPFAIACQEALGWSVVPHAIERLLVKHPALQFTFKTVFMEQGAGPLLTGDADVLLTFILEDQDDPAIEKVILCNPTPYAMVRKGHPLDRDGAPVTVEEIAAYPQMTMEDGPAFAFFNQIFRDRGLDPERGMVSNISSGAQALLGTSDQVSLRIVRPGHDRSPLGHPLAYLPIIGLEAGANLVAATVRGRHLNQSAKVAAFIDECHAMFASGLMKKHFFY